MNGMNAARLEFAGARRFDGITAFHWIVCALAASLPNEAIFGGFGPSAGQATRSPSFFLGLMATAMSIFAMKRIARTIARQPALILMVMAFFVALVVLAIHIFVGEAKLQPQHAIDRPFKSLWMACMFAATAALPEWRRRLTWSFVFGWCVFLAVAMFAIASGRASVVQHFSATRVSVLAMNENVQSLFAAAGAVMMLVFALTARRRIAIALCTVSAALGLGVFTVGSSRTAFVALTASLSYVVVVAFFWRRTRQHAAIARRLAVVGAIAIVVFVVSLSVNDVFREGANSIQVRLGDAARGEDLGHRDVIARMALEIALDNPLGIGLGRTSDFLGMDPHNSYLKLAAEGGVVAIVLLVAANFLLFRRLRRSIRTLDRVEVAAGAGCIVYIVGAAFGQALVESPYWLFFALVVTLPRQLDPVPGARHRS